MTEEKVHEALENTFAHIVAESGEVVGGRNIIAHVTDVGQSVFMSPLTEKLQTTRDAFYNECGRAVAEWHVRGWKPLATFPNGITRCLRFYNRKAESYV